MPCSNCKKNPVLTLGSIQLCKPCYIRYFEAKVFKTIARYNLVREGDRVAVGVSGGKDSFTALYLMNKLAETKRRIDIAAIAIDEGIKGYRNLRPLTDYCKANGIRLVVAGFRERFGYTLDSMLKKTDVKACTLCGALRRNLLNATARRLKADKLATGHNLDDEAQSFLMNVFKNNIDVSARLGPVTGIVRDRRFVPRIKPLYFLTEREVAAYALIKKFPVRYAECPYSAGSFRSEVRDMLNSFEERHPQIKHSVVNSFLRILPLLRKLPAAGIESCKTCGEPCAGDMCKVCKLLKLL